MIDELHDWLFPEACQGPTCSSQIPTTKQRIKKIETGQYQQMELKFNFYQDECCAILDKRVM